MHALPSAGLSVAGPLATTTLDSLRAFFATTSHNPSADHWGALSDVAEHLEAMADHQLPPKVYLSSLCPGLGKSQTTLHFARALLASADHRGVGMLICVGRISEAASMASALANHKASVAVLTSDKDANALGGVSSDNIGSAQILITTQQRIERASDGRAFETIAAFHYNGAARAVRVWDEAWLPGVAVTLNPDDVGVLFKAAQKVSPAFNAALWAFAALLRTVESSDLVDVPDWQQLHGVSLQDLMAALPGGDGIVRDDDRMIATSLFILAGRSARAWKDNKGGGVVLSYRDTLPEDLRPLLVLDASGRVRHTYHDMTQCRDVVRLREGVKDYSPLTIHHWKTSGAKQGFKNNGAELARGIARTILTKPGEDWLVVVHRPDGRVGNVEKDVRRFLAKGIVAGVVSFISWGSHMATNDFVDVGNLILAGTLFMRPSHYVALTHLAQDRPTADGLASQEEIERTTQGEHANLVLQAVCRGRVRRSDGGRCYPMDAYIIASQRSGIAQALPTIFPGCTVKAWEPLEKPPLAGTLNDAAQFLRSEILRGVEWVSGRSIAVALGMDWANFHRRFVRTTDWAEVMAVAGVDELIGARNALGYRKAVMAVAA